MTPLTTSKKWITRISGDYPLVIAGPCSAETEEQVMETAKQLKDPRIKIFRAGVWKPRTRPGNFEGVGEKALPWLQKVKRETSLKIAIEVANTKHVELALKHDIDVLWIGARTSVNPFAVQEIADALKGTDKIVMIKNPVNPDLALWIGALERVLNNGMEKIAVIHRGFSRYRPGKYRNEPNWQLALEFKNTYPEIPLLIDPSHICGRRECIPEIIQVALNLQYDGLMVETHRNPDQAWSDAKQQITPQKLLEILNSLKIPRKEFRQQKTLETLRLLRKQIDHLDEELLSLLMERMKIAEEIGKIKKREKVTILQPHRWEEIRKNVLRKGTALGLSEEFVLRIFNTIHQESIERQKKIVLE